MDKGHQVWCIWLKNTTKLRDMFPVDKLEEAKEEN